jgi:hypothetical protein
MDELIIEYIFDLCEVKGGITVFFDGKQVYYDVLKKHLGVLFDLKEWEVDGYMITCFLDMNSDFDYSHFMLYLKPPPLKMPSGNLVYLDYTYQDNPDGAIDWEAVQRNHSRYRYYGGIDPALAYGDITIGVSSRGFGELSHPNTLPDDNGFNIARAVAEQTFNLELTPLDEDLEE